MADVNQLSRARPPPTREHSRKALKYLDVGLETALGSGDIKIVRSDFLLNNDVEACLSRRQDLEAMERDGVARVFLPPSEAVLALQAGNRSIAVLSYCWVSAEHPSAQGVHYLTAVRRFLQSAHGTHVVGVFWDYASLPQKPRTEQDQDIFARALAVMGDLYASTLGTTVMRHQAVAPRPEGLDEGLYNGTPYSARGWTNFESAVSSEAIARAAFFPGFTETIKELPPKVVEIDGEAPRVEEDGFTTFAEEVLHHQQWLCCWSANIQLARVLPTSIAIRVQRYRLSIENAKFTKQTDQAVVVGLYNKYMSDIGLAFVAMAKPADCRFNGEPATHGRQRDSQGVIHYPDGTQYEGGWKDYKPDGRGTLYGASGTRYSGEWKEGVLKRQDADGEDGDAVEP